jgi:hypothetical protein
LKGRLIGQSSDLRIDYYIIATSRSRISQALAVSPSLNISAATQFRACGLLER